MLKGSGHGIILSFQKSNVLVNCGSADVADPCEFRRMGLLAFVGGIVAKKGGGNVFFAHLRTPDLPSLGSGVLHARPHSRSNHRQRYSGASSYLEVGCVGQFHNGGGCLCHLSLDCLANSSLHLNVHHSKLPFCRLIGLGGRSQPLFLFFEVLFPSIFMAFLHS